MRASLLALGLLGLMVSGAVAQEVGVTSAINQSAIGLAPGQGPKTMYLGDKIIHNQKITTNATGLLQILLADGTSFTVGPNSSMTIDSFVYDPNAGTAKVVADLGTGVFRFIGGKSSKSPDGVTLNTPVGTVGIQGGITNLDFSGATDAHIDMVYGVGVKLTNGTTVIGDLYHSGYSIVIGTDGKAGVVKTPPEWSQAFQTAMTGHGSGGGVSGTKVAGLGGTNKTSDTPTTPNSANAPSAPDPQSPITTWAQIENSDLRGVSAQYDGTYDADLTYTPRGSHPTTTVTALTDEDFNLVYSFATRKGVATFDVPVTSHQSVDISVPVLPTDTTYATFGNAYDVTHHVLFVTSHDSGEINGMFLNTNGVASSVVGTFDAQHSDPLLGKLDLNGAFAGNYTPPTH